jgi:hypothetical protein
MMDRHFRYNEHFKLSFDLSEGYEKLLQTLSEDELKELLDEIEYEIENTAHLVFTESQLQVPVDTGLLKSTGKITKIRDSTGIEYDITYGTDYGLWVHEVPMNHDGIGEKDKYLEDPVKVQETPFVKQLKKIVETYFGGGV